MPLDRVTITGADDSVDPTDLLVLSREYPFLECGILVSAKHQGEPRFPTHAWIERLQDLACMTQCGHLALHLCGEWVRDLLQGVINIPQGMRVQFERMQLNFSGEWIAYRSVAFYKALQRLSPCQIIFQIDRHGGREYLNKVEDQNDNESVDAVPLFDLSGGTGTPPSFWPNAHSFAADRSPCGYAGGLGPDNLEEQLPRIAEAAGDVRWWIDIESGVRSDEGRQFDLAKARRCLKIAAPWVQREEGN